MFGHTIGDTTDENVMAILGNFGPLPLRATQGHSGPLRAYQTVLSIANLIYLAITPINKKIFSMIKS